jgi:putative membrane protein
MLKQIFINFGRLLMIGVWGILLLNLFQPFPKPLKYLMHVVLIFTFFMHALQLLMIKSTRSPDKAKISAWQEFKIFAFGVFELMDLQRKDRG